MPILKRIVGRDLTAKRRPVVGRASCLSEMEVH